MNSQDQPRDEQTGTSPTRQTPSQEKANEEPAELVDSHNLAASLREYLASDATREARRSVFVWELDSGHIRNTQTGESASVKYWDATVEWPSDSLQQASEAIARAVDGNIRAKHWTLRAPSGNHNAQVSQDKLIFEAALRVVGATWETWGEEDPQELSRKLETPVLAEDTLWLLEEDATRRDQIFGRWDQNVTMESYEQQGTG